MKYFFKIKERHIFKQRSIKMSSIQNISLYLPCVFSKYDDKYVRNAFKHIGDISNIDFVSKMNDRGNYYNSVYIHFNSWYNNVESYVLYNDVINEHVQARVYHDGDKWYWIVLQNTAKKVNSGNRRQMIDLSDMKKEEEVKKEVKEVKEDVEIDELIEEDEEEYNKYLITIDGRYVQELEAENERLRELLDAHYFSED